MIGQSNLSLNWDLLPYGIGGLVLAVDSFRNTCDAFREFQHVIFSKEKKEDEKAKVNHSALSYIFGDDSLRSRAKYMCKSLIKASIASIEAYVVYRICSSGSSNTGNEKTPGDNYPYTEEDLKLMQYKRDVIDRAINASNIIKATVCLERHDEDPFSQFLMNKCAQDGYYSEKLNDDEKEYSLGEGYQCMRQAALTGYSKVLHSEPPRTENILDNTNNTEVPPRSNESPKVEKILDNTNSTKVPPASNNSQTTQKETTRAKLDRFMQREDILALFRELSSSGIPSPVMSSEVRKELLAVLAPPGATKNEMQSMQNLVLDQKIQFTEMLGGLKEKGKELLKLSKEVLESYKATEMTGKYGPLIINYTNMCETDFFEMPAVQFIGYNTSYMCDTYNGKKEQVAKVKKYQKKIAHLFPSSDNTNCREVLDELLESDKSLKKYLPPKLADWFIDYRNEVNKGDGGN